MIQIGLRITICHISIMGKGGKNRYNDVRGRQNFRYKLCSKDNIEIDLISDKILDGNFRNHCRGRGWTMFLRFSMKRNKFISRKETLHVTIMLNSIKR